jgi:hypothetical protein
VLAANKIGIDLFIYRLQQIIHVYKKIPESMDRALWIATFDLFPARKGKFLLSYIDTL